MSCFYRKVSDCVSALLCVFGGGETFQFADEVDRSNTKSIKLFPTQRELKGLEIRY